MLSFFFFLRDSLFLVFLCLIFWSDPILLLSICRFVQCFVDILERLITCAVYLFSDFGKISCLIFFF
jgi:hypothetical protein